MSKVQLVMTEQRQSINLSVLLLIYCNIQTMYFIKVLCVYGLVSLLYVSVYNYQLSIYLSIRRPLSIAIYYTGDEGGMATAVLGNIGEFVPEKEDWTQYATRLRYFFTMNSIIEESAKKAMLLTVVGPAVFRTLTSLVSPATVDDKTFKELTDTLEQYYSPKPSEIVQWFRFNTRCRQLTESVSAFVTELRSLAQHRNYGDSLNSMLRDRLVCGVNDVQMQRQLLRVKDLDFEKVYTTSLAIEAALRDTHTCSTLQQQQQCVSSLRDEEAVVQSFSIPTSRVNKWTRDNHVFAVVAGTM